MKGHRLNIPGIVVPGHENVYLGSSYPVEYQPQVELVINTLLRPSEQGGFGMSSDQVFELVAAGYYPDYAQQILSDPDNGRGGWLLQWENQR